MERKLIYVMDPHFDPKVKIFWTEYLNRKQIEFQDWEGSVEDFTRQWKDLTQQASGFWISEDFHSHIKAIPVTWRQQLLMMDAADSLFFTDNKWLPECLIRPILLESILKKSPYLDFRARAYVVGVGMNSRISISVLAQLGYKNISLISLDDESSLSSINQLIENTKVKSFNITFEVLHHNDLVLRPNDGSILINTAPRSEKALMEDISYFNFLLKGSLVVDTNPYEMGNSLTKEAQAVGHFLIDGYDLFVRKYAAFLKKILPNLSLTIDQYLLHWKEFNAS